jgi:hypothetical protein
MKAELPIGVQSGFELLILTIGPLHIDTEISSSVEEQ